MDTEIIDGIKKFSRFRGYYHALAGILGKSLIQLFLDTGIDEQDGATMEEIKTLYIKANYPGNIIYFQKANDLKAYICYSLGRYSPDLRIKLPVGFVTENNVTDVVVVKACVKEIKEYNLTDFRDADPTTRLFTLSKYTSYKLLWLYETGVRYRQKPDDKL